MLVEAGFTRLQEAWPDHPASVRRRVVDHLSGVDIPTLGTAFRSIVEASET